MSDKKEKKLTQRDKEPLEEFARSLFEHMKSMPPDPCIYDSPLVFSITEYRVNVDEGIERVKESENPSKEDDS